MSIVNLGRSSVSECPRGKAVDSVARKVEQGHVLISRGDASRVVANICRSTPCRSVIPAVRNVCVPDGGPVGDFLSPEYKHIDTIRSSDVRKGARQFLWTENLRGAPGG